ncbi:MAG TPA: DUF4124 domain-containing protein [Usitatibacter sp.]|jgi:hypothetical protein|nr:DUF4124 domain-containing protein [Usitatibacter sp.]
MKTVWLAGLAIAASTAALAQSTIYKHVDESGRITYSNKPMKGAVVMELDPITTIPATPTGNLVARPAAAVDKSDDAKPEARPAVAIVTPVPQPKPVLASIAVDVQRKRDSDRRRILEDELKSEEESLGVVRNAILQEQQNPQLVAAVRVAQQTSDPTPSQLAEFRSNIDKASGRIRGLQATAAEHDKNIEALKKELGALKP